MSSRKTVQAPTDRKEFFGHGAPRSPLISTAEDLPGGAEPSSADRRLASKRPVSKLVTALQPSSGWVETGPVAPSRTRIGTASAARDSAVSKSVGRSQAQVFGPDLSRRRGQEEQEHSQTLCSRRIYCAQERQTAEQERSSVLSGRNQDSCASCTRL